ncbi:MAG: class I SAM-dependent methyltransferase, partial [bacterium]
MFDFGKNWEDYSKRILNCEKLDAAQESIINLLGKDALKSKSFLDIGCGTGIFSISAANLGASKVVGLDVNPRCIDVCKKNSQKFINKEIQPEFKVVSVLDSRQLYELGTFDLVYAWGS